jgi:penicillin amidase
MDNSTKTFTLKAIHGEITIKRNEHGIPEISAKNREDLYYGLGHAHASDRLVQMLLVRAIARGEASEKFAGTDELIEIDKFMRWINFRKDNDHEMSKLKPDVKKELDAYCAGINSVIDEGKRPFEFKLTGYKPERWLPEDSLITVKVMGYIGLAQAQGDMEKFLIQLIQNDVPEEKIRAIFPYLKEEINFELIKEINLAKPIVPGDLFNTILPNIKASNNWVVSGKRTLSGHPLLASDPHMEVNRLPALWYEAVLNLPENYMMGITMPGVPVVVMGRTRDIAWGGTYGFMDMIDYFIEECKDEQYMIDGNWKPFTIRKETIHPKKKKPMTFTFYENQHGVLEGDPKVPGKYLAMAFTGRDNAGSEIFNLLMRTDEIKTVPEAQKKFRQLTMPTFNWVLADREGNIGYQMNGKMPKRPEGISGLLPIPGWNSTNDWQGYEDPALLPNELNPENGYFATANNDMNEFGTLKPINLPMADYRHKRILELLEENDKIDPEYVKKMQYDLYSRQAELLMPLFARFIQDTEN